MEKKKVSIYIGENNYNNIKALKETTDVNMSDLIDGILSKYFETGSVEAYKRSEENLSKPTKADLSEVLAAIDEIKNRIQLSNDLIGASYRVSDMAARLLYNGLNARSIDQGNNFSIRPDASTFEVIKKNVYQDFSSLRLGELAIEDFLDPKEKVTEAELYDVENEPVNESKNHFSPIFTEDESQEKPSDMSKYNKLFNIANGLNK